ncbi:MAG: hypothetical protein PHC28_01275 [Flavobacterium sp.]|uniref:hypothetical protein n=1 Tax=Flavobacterium sp. TaxID=239 RepID=UPI0026195109|nr:hypothetical protein [Flavobacterium sp.]MDD5149100.1 hypothetical protein [Flavobacterium sp.]
MKKQFILLSLILFSCLALASAATTINTCNLNVTLVNQDPYPATPDSYIKVVFQVSNAYDSDCGGAYFELAPSYPFSLDENDSWRFLEEGTVLSSEYSQDWMIAYKIRVDKDALDGENLIEVHYGPGTKYSDTYLTAKFNITIKDARTEFDAVIQESSDSEVSIAIANVGKYTANSVVVRIPEQENFQASGTDGQMVGNLESGDYTIVSFTISQILNMTQSRENPQSTSQTKNLSFDIYYTDNIGERRVVNMELPFSSTSGNITTTTSGNFPSGFPGQQQTSFFSLRNFIILLIILIIGFILYKKYPAQSKNLYEKIKTKIKNLFKKKNLDKGEIPDWVKNSKAKEKK